MQERILQVLNGMGSGGVEKYVLDLFRYIDREKFIFDFLIYHEVCLRILVFISLYMLNLSKLAATKLFTF